MTSLAALLTMDNGIAKLFDAEAELAAMIEVEAALARAEAATGFIPEKAARHITDVCALFSPDRQQIETAMLRDGVAVPELVRQLRLAVGEKYADYLHKGATSQDIIDTGLMLRLKRVFEHLDRLLTSVICQITRLRKDYGDKPYMAHTRMQAALPMHVTDKLASWLNALASHKGRLAAISTNALAIQSGGAVGNNAGLGAHADKINNRLAQELQLAPATSWHTDRSRIMDIAQAFSLLTGTLGKIGQDTALMAQNEIHAIKLANSGASSVMRHKHNPVKAEILVSIARLQAGLLGTIAQSMVHENERSGAAWTLEWLVLPQMAITAGGALIQAENMLENASF